MKTDYSTSTVTVAELQSHTLTGVVQHEIEKMILRGELVPGQRLNEKLVADKLSVSRGPVREACRALAELGLVYLIPNRGVFIKRLTKSDAIEVYDLRAGLIGSPDTIKQRLREFEAAHVDQVILLNQTGRTPHEDICASLELFAREVMPEFHAREPEHQRWKAEVLAGKIALEDLDTDGFKVYAHQNEDIVRLTPAELKQKMAAKEAEKTS